MQPLGKAVKNQQRLAEATGIGKNLKKLHKENQELLGIFVTPM